MAVTFHFDPSCPWTWVTSRWLQRAARAERFTIEWAPLSLAHLHECDDDETEAMHRLHLAGHAASRVVQRLLDRGDDAGVERFYTAYGEQVHAAERTDAQTVEEVRAVAEAVVPDAAGAVDDESLDRVLAERTDEAIAAAGGDVGSPVLRWDDGPALFGPILLQAPHEAERVVALYRAARALACEPAFSELQRGRSGGPDVRAS